MNKIITFIATVLSLIMIPYPIKAHAEENRSGFCYTIINGEATVTGFEGTPEIVNIPPTLEECPVTQVRDNAFYKCTSLKEIYLPESITQLGHHSFYGCSSLKSVSLPSGVSFIGMGCFSGCTALEQVKLPTALTILPDSCFRDCVSLTEIYLPQSAAAVEKFCFAGCESLQNIYLGEQIESIGSYSFYMCDSLESVYIPPSVKNIGEYAFGFTQHDNEQIQIDEFMIYGTQNSAAQSYAEGNQSEFTIAEDSAQAFAQINNTKLVRDLPLPLILGGALLMLAIIIFMLKQLKSSN